MQQRECVSGCDDVCTRALQHGAPARKPDRATCVHVQRVWPRRSGVGRHVPTYARAFELTVDVADADDCAVTWALRADGLVPPFILFNASGSWREGEEGDHRGVA